MRVLAVGDQAADDARVGERRPDDARRARRELAHRIIEMGDGARAGVEDGLRLLRARVRMAEADDDPGFRQPRDALKRDRDGGERDHRHACARLDQGVGVLSLHRTDEFGRMHALAPGIDEWPLDMDSERAGNAFVRLSRRRERG